MEDGFYAYVTDYWNWIDASSSIINLVFLVFLNIDVLLDHTVISVETVRTLGAVGCWIMWIKLFYWMRLF